MERLSTSCLGAELFTLSFSRIPDACVAVLQDKVVKTDPAPHFAGATYSAYALTWCFVFRRRFRPKYKPKFEPRFEPCWRNWSRASKPVQEEIGSALQLGLRVCRRQAILGMRSRSPIRLKPRKSALGWGRGSFGFGSFPVDSSPWLCFSEHMHFTRSLTAFVFLKDGRG